MHRILLIAHQTLGGDHLAEVIRARIAAGPTRFLLLVPATHHTDLMVVLAEAFAVQGGIHPPAATLDADAAASSRLEAGLAWMRGLGAAVSGVVAEHDPLREVAELLAEQPCAEIIVSTLPHGVSAWLHQDLPHRLERATAVPVTVVSASHPLTG